MQIAIEDRGAFASAIVKLQAGETFVSESGAMYRTSAEVDTDVTTRSKGKGGILGGLKRLLGGESFFLSKYTAAGGVAGEVGIAPMLPGDVMQVELDGSSRWLCAGGSYLGSSEELALDTQFQGLRGMLSGENLYFLSVEGQGSLLVGAFGCIREAKIDGEVVVDTGHVVAFEDTLTYEISKAGGSWLKSFLGGEGLVMKFKGAGRLLVQSHNPGAFGSKLGRMLPPRKA
jgi:uncharacterized protein (TIGR00266 family)